MIDLFTELLVYLTKNRLGGVTYGINDILEQQLIPYSELDKAKIEEINSLKITKVENTFGIDLNKSLNSCLSLLPVTDIDIECSDDESTIINKYFPLVKENKLFQQNKAQSHEMQKMSEIEMLKFISTRGIGTHLLKKIVNQKDYS